MSLYSLALFLHVSGVVGTFVCLGIWLFGLAAMLRARLVIVVLISPIGAFVLDPRMRTIFAEAQEVPDGLLPDRLNTRTRDPILGAASTLTTLLLGIVFLMTTKLSPVIAILVMGVALFLGLLVSLPIWHAARRRTQHTAAPGSYDEVDPFLRKTRLYEAMVE